jgi:hypothetical protein
MIIPSVLHAQMELYFRGGIMEYTFCSSDVTELAKAMLKVQAALSPALKDKTNPFTKSTYATLNSVMDSCRTALLAESIWLTQYPSPVESGNLGLVTKLTHADSGQWQSSLLVIPLPKADPQGYGSALTYARRYALSAMLGMVTEDDDDGEAAKSPSPRRASQKNCDNSPQKHDSCEDEPRHGGTSKNALKSKPEERLFRSLPKIDGINYQSVTAQDGRSCIVASGNTQAKKALLTGAGFKWSEQKHMWWKYSEVS